MAIQCNLTLHVSTNRAERTGLVPHSGPDNQVRGDLMLLILFSEVAPPTLMRECAVLGYLPLPFHSEHQLGNSRPRGNPSATTFWLQAPSSAVWSALFFQAPLCPDPKEEYGGDRMINKARRCGHAPGRQR